MTTVLADPVVDGERLDNIGHAGRI